MTTRDHQLVELDFFYFIQDSRTKKSNGSKLSAGACSTAATGQQGVMFGTA